HRHLHHIAAIIEAADLSAAVRSGALTVFQRLAEAEAQVHGSTVAKVHFHEVGAVDAIVDIVGSLVGLEALGVDRVEASTLPVGGGSVMSEHGRIPVPAPATTILLQGVPIKGGPVEAELVTPTGAALLATLCKRFGPLPDFTLHSIGVGAGTREFPEHPNVLRVLVGEGTGTVTHRSVAVLETALDDENPQFAAAIIPTLLAAGALDAMLVPTTMKKGRAGWWLVVVCEPLDSERLAALVLARTTALGVRRRIDERFELPRRIEHVETAFGTIAVKVATLPDGSQRAIPEFEEVREASERSGKSLREVSEAATRAWESGSNG
ncbi:MAG: nickel pincer cofactor biosynthesis protein LarC, partial [Candidatus Eisenbacteria bacterium]